MISRLPIFYLLAALLIPGSASADATTEGAATGNAIRGVIERQIAAFGRDDGPGAFAFASPNIRTKFQTPEIFMEMVRRKYASVYRPSEVTFRDLHAGPRGPVQEVLLVGPNGLAVMALYLMERQPDGSWKINGVQLLEVPDLTI